MTREEAIKKVRQMSLPKETMEILEALAPELKESEDERMLREIKRYIKEQGDKPTGLPNGTAAVADMIAYLEKQQEQKPASISRGHEIEKPAEWNDTDMKEARDNLISVCRDWERGMQTALLPIAAVRARYFLEHLTEPKPVEWSDEDENMLEATDESLYCYESGKAPEAVAQIETERCWLQSLPERFSLQPKPEWSVEDEDRIRQIERIAQQANCTQKLQEEIHDWLKSLRPSWKPTRSRWKHWTRQSLCVWE